MIHIENACARVLVVIMQLMLLSLPVYADFNPENPPEPNITRRLTVLASPAEAGYAGNEGNYRPGEQVSIYSYPYDWNYKLKYWTINGHKYHETNHDFWYTMGDSAVTFIAHYEYETPTPPPFDPSNPPEPYVKQNITVELDPDQGGYIEGAGSYSADEYAYIVAYLDAEYELEYWTLNGHPWHETNYGFHYQVGDTNAHFVAHIAKKHLITLKTSPRAAGSSMMSMNGMPFTDQLVTKGRKIDFTTTGNEDYKFRHWTINGHKHTSATSFQYTVGDSAASVVAVYNYVGVGDTTLFNPDSPPEPDLREDVTIIVIPHDYTKGSTEGGGTYLYGAYDTIYAYPAEGFRFRAWNDSVTDNPRIIQALSDSLFIAYFECDTAIWKDTVCYGESIQIEEHTINETGHYEFYTTKPNGIYTWNIVDLLVWKEMSTTINVQLCYGEKYEHDGVVYGTSGTYTRTYPKAIGCDSTVTINLNILPKIEMTIIDTTICYGESYYCNADSVTYTATTLNKSITLTDIHGCDSVVILNLTVLPAVPVTVIDTVTCNDVPFYWHVTGLSYTGTQVVDATLTDIHGCDSVVRLNLVELPAEAPVVVYDTTCYGVPYVWNITGKQYTGSCVVDTIMKSDNGCDIRTTLHLTELPAIPTTDIDTTICYGDAYYFHANRSVYTTSVDTIITLQDVHGCDSLVHLNLTVLPKVPVTVIDTTICYGESYYCSADSVTYTATMLNKSITLTDIHGCDSVVILNLTVLPAVPVTILRDTLCYGEQYIFNNTTYTESTIVDATFMDVNGCDSMVTLMLHVWPNNMDSLVLTEYLCYEQDAFVWEVNNERYTTDTLVKAVLSDMHGCDSVVFLNVIAMPLLTDTLSETICYGDSYAWLGNIYTTTGIYDQTLTSVTGCDSIVVLNLTVLPEVENILVTDTICYADSYVWNGKIYTTSASDTIVMQDVNGCDSVVILSLTVLDSLSVIVVDTTICYGESIQWFGDTLYTSVSGRYDTLLTIYGCEQVMKLNLTVLPEILPTSETIVACDAYMWHGKDYTMSGTYVDTTLTANGCDSITNLHLTILRSTIGDPDTVVVCYGETYVWEGVEYNKSGFYTTTLNNATGCDSTAYLHLIVLPEVLPIEESVTICYGESYTWFEHAYNESGDYTITYINDDGCSGIAILHLNVLPEVPVIEEWMEICDGESYTWHGKTCSKSGDYTTQYTNENGCLCEILLHLTVWPKNDPIEDWATITDNDTYTWYGKTYDTEGNYSIILQDQHGCDQEMILHLEVQVLDFTINAVEACADDPYVDFELYSDMTIERIEFKFDESGLWRDTVVYMPKQYISIPNSARAGVYNAVISAYADSKYLGSKNQKFILRFPSNVLHQHWDNFIGVLTYNYNGGYDFVSFQWYKDNQPLAGETKSYLSTPLEMGALYSAMLEDVNGNRIMTCPIIATHQEELYLYPSLLQPNEIIHIRTTQKAAIEMYDITGVQLMATDWETGNLQLQAPAIGGMYIIKVIYHDASNKVLTRKITIR